MAVPSSGGWKAAPWGGGGGSSCALRSYTLAPRWSSQLHSDIARAADPEEVPQGRWLVSTERPLVTLPLTLKHSSLRPGR